MPNTKKKTKTARVPRSRPLTDEEIAYARETWALIEALPVEESPAYKRMNEQKDKE